MRNIILAVLILICVSCLEHIDTRKIRILNEANQPIYIFRSQNDSFKDPYIDYSMDTILKYEKVERGKVYNLRNVTGWDSYIKDSENSKMRIFIVLKDSVTRYGMKNVIERSVYTNKFEIDMVDLKKWIGR